MARSIKQLTYDELRQLIDKVDKDILVAHGRNDRVKWHQLCDLHSVLDKEAKSRARRIGVDSTAFEYDIAL